jgi:acyl-coenzyme A synthetase/AMP-(fatty) acid ligase
VQDVAVIGIYDEQQHTEVPRAFVVLAPGYSPSSSLADQIRRWLNERVIYYKRLRGGVQFVSFIPKSPAGKILRRALKTSMAQSTAPQAKL